VHKGYQTIASKKETEVAELREKIGQLRIELSSFNELRAIEKTAAPKRIAEAEVRFI